MCKARGKDKEIHLSMWRMQQSLIMLLGEEFALSWAKVKTCTIGGFTIHESRSLELLT